jgi:hypothetical protein
MLQVLFQKQMAGNDLGGVLTIVSLNPEKYMNFQKKERS